MGITSLHRVYAKTHDWDANVVFWEGLGLRFAGRWVREGHYVGRPGDVAPGTLPASKVFSPSAAPMPTLWEKL